MVFKQDPFTGTSGAQSGSHFNQHTFDKNLLENRCPVERQKKLESIWQPMSSKTCTPDTLKSGRLPPTHTVAPRYLHKITTMLNSRFHRRMEKLLLLFPWSLLLLVGLRGAKELSIWKPLSNFPILLDWHELAVVGGEKGCQDKHKVTQF